MSFYKTGQITMGNMSNFTPIYEMPTKQLSDGSVWRRIHWLDVTTEKTFFTDKDEVKECINKANRYSRMGIVDNFRGNMISITNMLPQIDGTSGFTSGYSIASGTEYYKYGKPSLKIIATDSNSEATATSIGEYHLIPDHVYYARVEIFQETKVGGAGMYWPVAEPSFFGGKPVSAVKTWTIVSVIANRPSSDSDFATEKDAKFRLDFDNGKVAGNMWFSGVMLIDLTASFGTGNEPTKEWLDANIPYFTGTKKFDFSYFNKGKYEFMLTYPKLSTTLFNRWSQFSSPNESTVVGFTALETAWGGHNAGIRKMSGSAIYNCDSGSTWYAPIGQTSSWTSTQYIPAADGTSQTETELWVRIDLLSPSQLIEFYKQDNIISNDFIEY